MTSEVTSAARMRGQPLMALVLLALVWVGIRVLAWDSPFPSPELAAVSDVELVVGKDVPASRNDLSQPFLQPAVPYQGKVSALASLMASPLIAGPKDLISADSDPVAEQPSRSYPAEAELVDHSLDLFSLVPPPNSQAGRPALPSPALPQPAEASRWELYAWAFLRGDSGGLLANSLSPGQPSYGASQAGAILRYRLPVAEPHRLKAYGRVTRALVENGESELALGLAGRAVPSLPIVLNGEVRATRVGGKDELRPAVFVVSEVPPIILPHGFRAEIYGQAGYVGGDFATAFADGQVRVDRAVIKSEQADIRLGAGAWAGAQSGAARVDVGPALSTRIDVAGVPLRASVDYRIRLAGDAEPGDGIAVTLSSGF